MLTLGQIENSEYNLLGAMSEDDFLQALDLSGPNDKKKLFRKMQNQTRVATNATTNQYPFSAAFLTTAILSVLLV